MILSLSLCSLQATNNYLIKHSVNQKETNASKEDNVNASIKKKRVCGKIVLFDRYRFVIKTGWVVACR